MLLDTEYSLFNGAFRDKRLDRRVGNFLKSMVTHESAIINQCCESKTEKIGAYRMINNSGLELDSMVKRLQEDCVRQIHGSHVLCIQDTTEINYTRLVNRLDADDPDIGPMCCSSSKGFFCHPTLVIDAVSRVPLGFSNVRLWSRPMNAGNKHSRNYSKKKIADKESYRWIESSRTSSRVLPQEVTKTIIADRESDIYEALYQIPRIGCEFLLRSSADRKIDNEECHLLEKMLSLPCSHTYELKVKGNHSRKSRTAKMELRFGKVTLQRPDKVTVEYPGNLTVNCIHVVEKGETIPVNESPIEWRLLTTHTVENAEDAMQCVEWYKLRWYIEEVFRLLKSDGMNVESAQLETGEALQKTVVLSLVAALQIMSLKLSYDRRDEQTAVTLVFTALQISLLKVLLRMVEGKTAKQKNPFKQDSLAWAAWIIARLGHWDGYGSQDPPGYITFKRGMQRFWDRFELYQFVKEDV